MALCARASRPLASRGILSDGKQHGSRKSSLSRVLF
nr:MAG TPA: hypothetical protein [Caudoviricetes sp.]